MRNIGYAFFALGAALFLVIGPLAGELPLGIMVGVAFVLAGVFFQRRRTMKGQA